MGKLEGVVEKERRTVVLLRWEKANSSRIALNDECDSDLLNAMSCWTRKGMCRLRTLRMKSLVHLI